MTETILTPICEAEFLGFSYGFRPGRGAHDALDALAVGITGGARSTGWWTATSAHSSITVSRDWLVRFLEHRIADKRVIRLIIKWLNAGVMEAGEWRDDLRGTPQGSVASPVLANVYLHYVLDLWFQKKWRQTRSQTAIRSSCGTPDDFVVGFQYKRDAERFLEAVRQRFESFDLALHPEKTRLIEFGRFAHGNRQRRGQGRPETFDFLGLHALLHEDQKRVFPDRTQAGGKADEPNAEADKGGAAQTHACECRGHGEMDWVGCLRGWLNYYAVPRHQPVPVPLCSASQAAVADCYCAADRKRTAPSGPASTRLAERYWPKLEIRHPWPDQRLAVGARRRSAARGRSRMP